MRVEIHGMLLAWLMAAVAAAAEPNDEVRALLEGVGEIAAPGSVGSLAVLGPNARAVVGGGKGVQQPVVACTRWQQGRIVVWAHDGYLTPNELQTGDTGRLMTNAIRWTAGEAVGSPRVGIISGQNLQRWLRNQEFSVVRLASDGWHKELANVDVLVLKAPQLDGHDPQAAVKAFLGRGGGLIAADTGWGWAQLNPTKSLSADHPGNQLLHAAGLLWSAGFSDSNSPKVFKAGQLPAAELNATIALDQLLEQPSGKATPKTRQAVASVQSAMAVLPKNDTFLLPKLIQARKTAGAALVPSAQNPIKAQSGLARALIALDVHQMQHQDAREVRPHPAAATFPGEVPKAAKTVGRTLSIDTRIPDWHSTGLYAAPGKLISVSLPASAAQAGLILRIGCHSDSLMDLPQWNRMPQVCRTWPLNATMLEAAHALGGLVYVEVPEGCQLGNVEIRIEGAVPAPRFVLGETTRAQWLSEQRGLPGPWAELQTSKLIITVPSRAIRELRNPIELMKTWDQVLDACADLAGIPHQRKRPERFVVDEQISAGYMHSGYPIMAHLDVEKTLVDLTSITGNQVEPVWGFFHEIGHNHQAPEWTFDGTGEVTVNLFTMYVFDKVVKTSDLGLGLHKLDEAARNKKIKQYLESGAQFSVWKNDPFLALCMYIQMQQAFGWEAYLSVFAEYRQLSPQDRPQTEEQKRDQWMIRFSKQVNKNLGPFFQAWGVPTSDAARAEIAGLPRWMPRNFPPRSK